MSIRNHNTLPPDSVRDFTPVTVGFVDLYGFVWDQLQCDRYNKIGLKIQSYKDEGRNIPETLLNERFREFNAMHSINKGGVK